MPAPIVLGLDSASTTGWGVVQGDKVLLHGVTDASDRLRMNALAALICSKHRPDLVLIEDNYFAKDINVLKVLSRIVGAWEMAFAIRGVDTRLVVPSQWQSQILTGLLGKKALRDERKNACIRWVNITYRIKLLSTDAADGIAIATFGARRLLYESRLAVPGSIPRAAL